MGSRRAWATIIGLPSLFLFSYLITGRTILLPTAEDIAELWPYQRMAAEQWMDFRFPLWSPEILCGLPLGGWPHSNAFYPSIFIFMIWDYQTAIVINLYLHLAVFAAGTYALLRTLGFKPSSALPASVAVSFGVTLSFLQVHFLPTIYTAAWAPWIFAFSFSLVEKKRLFHLVGLALAFAAAILGGRYDLIIRDLLLLGAMAVLLLIIARSHAQGVGLWLVGGILGALLVAGQFLMHAEYSALSVRRLDLGFEYFCAHQRDGLTLAMYLGWLLTPTGFILGYGALRTSRKGLALAALLVMIVCLAWIWPPDFLLRFNFLVPLMNRLRYSNVAVIPASMALSVIFALGMEGWATKDNGRKWIMMVGFAGALFGLVYLAVFYGFGGISRNGSEMSIMTSSHLSGKRASAAALLAVALFLFWSAAAKRRNGSRFMGANNILLLLVLADVVVCSFFGALRLEKIKMPETPLDSKWPTTQYRPYRSLHIFPWSAWRDLSIPLQSGVMPYTRSIDGFISMPYGRYGEFLSLICPEAMKVDNETLEWEQFMGALKEDNFLTPDALRLLNYLNVGYYLVERDNLKFGSLYRFRWVDPSNLDAAGAWESDFESPAWTQKGPARWTHNLAKVADSRFKTQIQTAGRETWMAAVFTHKTLDDTGQIIFARAIQGQGAKIDIEADLDSTPSKADETRLTGAATPLSEKPGEFIWRDPRLESLGRPLEFSFSDGDADVFFNREVMPLAFMVHSARLIPSAAERLKYIANNTGRLATEAVIEKPLEIKLSPVQPGTEKVVVTSYRPQEVHLRAITKRPGLLIISDVYYPGWQAADEDGPPIKILPVNHAFRGVPLAKGVHSLKMTYRPYSFRLGLWCSIGSAITLALVLALRLVFRRN